MDTSLILVNISALYDILYICFGLLASIWGISKVIQHFKRWRS